MVQLKGVQGGTRVTHVNFIFFFSFSFPWEISTYLFFPFSGYIYSNYVILYIIVQNFVKLHFMFLKYVYIFHELWKDCCFVIRCFPIAIMTCGQGFSSHPDEGRLFLSALVMVQ